MRKIHAIKKYEVEYADASALTPDTLLTIISSYCEETGEDNPIEYNDLDNEYGIVEIDRDALQRIAEWESNPLYAEQIKQIIADSCGEDEGLVRIEIF